MKKTAKYSQQLHIFAKKGNHSLRATVQHTCSTMQSGNKYLFIGLLFVVCNVSVAQSNEDTKLTPEVADTLYYRDHSPGKATMYSAVLPGLGQIYNKDIWKVPIIYAGYAVIGYFIYDNTTNYKLYRDVYRDFLNGGTKYLTIVKTTEAKEELEGYKDYYRRYMELSFIAAAGLYVLNIVDATVSAYFFEYDISDDISMKITPVLQPIGYKTTLGFSCSIRF